MTTLADDILLHGLYDTPGVEFVTMRERNDMVRLGVASRPIVVVSNVADYMERTEVDGKLWSWRTDFPNVAPPFDAWWMEYEAPRFGKFANTTTGRIGAFFFASEKDSVNEVIADESKDAAHRRMLYEITGEAKWLMSMMMVLDYRDLRSPYAPMLLHLPVMADGTIPPGGEVASTSNRKMIEVMNEGAERDGRPVPDITELTQGLFELAYPFLLALSLMHCRNVNLIEGSHPRAARRRREKEQQRDPQLPGLVKFSTVNITPMQKVLREQGRSDEHGLRQALHICRGHFKHFEEKPLFGKHRGTFWWDSMVRGSKERGQVIHDYNVKTGE